MTGKAFSTMYGNVGNMLHDTTTAMDTLIKVWINDAYQDAWRRCLWADLINEDFTFESVVDQADYVFGAVKTVTLGDAGTGYSANDVLTLKQTGASGATVTVLTVDGSGAVLTISLTTGGKLYSVANGLAVTGGDGDDDCTINVTATNPAATDFGKELGVFDIANGHELRRYTIQDWWKKRGPDYNADSLDSGNSNKYIILPESWSLRLDPPPDTAETYAMPYQKEITDLSADADTPSIPTISTYLEYYATGMGFSYKKELDLADWWFNKAEFELAKLIKEEKVKVNQIYQRVLAGYSVPYVRNLLGDKSYDSI
jgi:hypothetical protein